MKRTYTILVFLMTMSFLATAQESNWYLSARVAKKNFVHSNNLTATLSPPDRGYYGGIGLGTYISPNVAVETGIEYYSFVLSVPFSSTQENTLYGMMRYNLISIPMSIRYDFYKRNNLQFYAKVSLSVDVKHDDNSLSSSEKENVSTIDLSEDKLLLNAGIEAGADYRLTNNLRIGAFANWTYAFNDAYTLEYNKYDASQPYTQYIPLNNKHFGFGLELKLDF